MYYLFCKNYFNPEIFLGLLNNNLFKPNTYKQTPKKLKIKSMKRYWVISKIPFLLYS